MTVSFKPVNNIRAGIEIMQGPALTICKESNTICCPQYENNAVKPENGRIGIDNKLIVVLVIVN